MESLELKGSGSGVQVQKMSVSPDRKTAICGGRDVLKLIDLEPQLKEKRNFRSGKSNLKHSAVELAWHPRQAPLILSASCKSDMILWNLERSGAKLLETVYNEHKMPVYSIQWHPTNDNVFISAGRDKCIKLWDRNIENCAKHIDCKNEQPNMVRFNPYQPDRIACAVDSGAIEFWDLRFEPHVVSRIQAHSRIARCVDWHPEYPDLIVSGGGDKIIKLWDMKTATAVNKVQTFATVSKVTWKSTHEVASISDVFDTNIYIWHLGFTSMPQYIFKGSRDYCDLTLLDDYLLSCTKDGLLSKCSYSMATRPMSYFCASALTVTPFNEIVACHNPLPTREPNQFTEMLESKPEVLTRPQSISNSKISFTDLGQDPSSLAYLANSYVFASDNLKDQCEHNKRVQEDNPVPSEQSIAVASMWDILPTLNQSNDPIIAEQLKECVNFYAEEGDIPTAVALASALDLKTNLIEDYGEHLRKLELRNAANSLDLPQPQPAVTVQIKCHCGREIEDKMCMKCKKHPTCGICRLPVKGLYAWCQGCNHGGHLR